MLHEPSVVMVYVFYHSVYRIPVGMYIGDVHENGNHQSAVMEIFVFVHLLNYHDTSVGRSHYGFSVSPLNNRIGQRKKLTISKYRMTLMAATI